jgi:hypothetical protein
MEDRAQKTSDSNSDCAHRVEKRLCVSGHAIDLKVFGHDQENIDILGAYFAVTKLPQINTRRRFPFWAASSRSTRRRPESQNLLGDEPQNRARNSRR